MMIPQSDILKARILVVDDEAVNVTLLERFLGDAGCTNVMSTMDPTTVGSLHRQHSFDLIVLDVQMPGMDGFEVMDSLKAESRDPYLPVIVLTAQPGHNLRALKAGARDFISKPFDLIEARTRIFNMLEVRLLYRKLEQHAKDLEQAVRERTAELRDSEARYRALAELATDWYWEQDQDGKVTRVSGPALEMLGIQIDSTEGAGRGSPATGWDDAEHSALRSRIDARAPFLDLAVSRTDADGHRRLFRVSGEPMFDGGARFIGYRGVGTEVIAVS